MKIVTYLMLGAVVFAIFRTHRSVQRAQTPQERNFIIRTSATAWLLGVLLLLALMILPDKARVILIIPGFLLSVSIAKAWHNSRKRLREKHAQEANLEKMKRVN